MSGNDYLSLDHDWTDRSQHHLVRPAAEVVAHALEMDAHDDEVGDLLIALLGFDAAIVTLAQSPSDRAGRVMLSALSWLLVD